MQLNLQQWIQKYDLFGHTPTMLIEKQRTFRTVYGLAYTAFMALILFVVLITSSVELGRHH